MSRGRIKFQIGKSGVTAGVLESLELAFKTHKVVRVGVLKSACRNREELKEMVYKLVEKLKGNYNWRIIGFTIILRRVGERDKR